VRLEVETVDWSVDMLPIVRGVSLEVTPGKLVGLLGPNGCGKSSLLRCIYRAYQPDCGMIALDGVNINRLTPQEFARVTGVVLQETPTEFEFTVQEVVLMGRSPHKRLFDRDTPQDSVIVRTALERVRMSAFSERQFNTLSGGEKQRVLIARALAQQARLLILDEPTNHLDIRYQLEVLELIKGLQVSGLVALHDLNLAAYFCDYLYLMKDGQVVASGTPETVLRSEVIHAVYEVHTEVIRHPITGKTHITYLPESSPT
jgi:iron complex transport system ATP-binding protein